VVPGVGRIHFDWKRPYFGDGGRDHTVWRSDNNLNQKGVFYLYQAHREPRPGLICSNWITSAELDLEGPLATEWQDFRCAIINNGVQLLMRSDELKWTGDNSSGRISVKNVYEAIENKKQNYVIGGWRKFLWSWDCPLKLKLFTWLVAENKILTWENLQHRGFMGPSYCILCKKNKETMFHLFVECPFTCAVWERVKKSINNLGAWTGNSISECFKNWKLQNSAYPTLPIFICWYIWIERNLAIFEDGSPSIHKVVFLSLLVMGDYKSPIKIRL
jgi:hypothetical protein